MYKRINKFTKEVKEGSFEELCDLDKRIWGELILLNPPVKSVKIPVFINPYLITYVAPENMIRFGAYVNSCFHVMRMMV